MKMKFFFISFNIFNFKTVLIYVFEEFCRIMSTNVEENSTLIFKMQINILSM